MFDCSYCLVYQGKPDTFKEQCEDPVEEGEDTVGDKEGIPEPEDKIDLLIDDILHDIVADIVITVARISPVSAHTVHCDSGHHQQLQY